MDYFKKVAVWVVVLFVLGGASVIWSKTGTFSFSKKAHISLTEEQESEDSDLPKASVSAEAALEHKNDVEEDEEEEIEDEDEDEREDDEFEDDDDERSSNPPPAPPVVVSGKTYTKAEVASHATKSSCWSMIDGAVYDLTSWIGQHPGGEAAITGLCGTDGTSAFHAQHKNNPKQANILVGLKIGVVAK